MRIVAGKHRGRRIPVPDTGEVRPTSDRVRESLFSILTHGDAYLPADTRVLDAFAGTGALGLEALSRGAGFSTFMDRDRDCIRRVAQTLDDLGEQGRAKTLRQDATRPGPADAPCDLVFLDPPYRKGLAPTALAALAEAGWIIAGTRVVVELDKTESFNAPAGYTVDADRSYGNTRIMVLTADG